MKHYFLILLIGLLTNFLQAQEVIATSGIYNENDYYIGSVLSCPNKLIENMNFQISQIKKDSIKGNNGIFVDNRDQRTYKWVRIGTQIWMAENLNYHTNKGSKCYDNNISNCEKYGKLYKWKIAQKVCPEGWHLPSDAEWKELEMYLGMSQSQADSTGWRGTDQGKQLKEGGTSGFNALLGGYRIFRGYYYFKDKQGGFWSSTPYETIKASYRALNKNTNKVGRNFNSTAYSFSVRCVKDE